MVLDVDQVNKRISLGMRQTEPNPWLLVEERYPVGTRVGGTIRNLTDFGAFVELEEGIDGLIHVSDMSCTWTKPTVEFPSASSRASQILGNLGSRTNTVLAWT